MTVRDSMMLALERVAPTSFLGSTLGLPGTERLKRGYADDLIGFMGLGDYRDKQTRELSTGTRRITELACLMALQPRLLLLDEPSSGIAQRETEALGALLDNLKRELDMTMVVIEHDIPLVMSLSNRIVAMDAGEVIAVGSPDEIRNNARVQDAYLGADRRAIERSDA
jgi:ABC-type branched-subunit amino acid transport system ATPase component